MFVMFHTVAVFFYTCTGNCKHNNRSCNEGKNALFHKDNFKAHKNHENFKGIGILP